MGETRWELLRGLDVFFNRYCGPLCPLLAMVRNHEVLHRCDVAFHDAAGGLIPVRVSMFAIPGQGGAASLIVHLLSARGADAEDSAFSAFDGHSARPRLDLTPREREVLVNLAQGKATARIAEELGVSVHTVRNHLERLSRKLHVHSRLEIVTTARRLGLIP